MKNMEDDDERGEGGKVEELLQTESVLKEDAVEKASLPREAKAEMEKVEAESDESSSAQRTKDDGDTLKGLIVVDGVGDESAIASRTTPTPTPTPTPSKESGAASAASSAASSAAASGDDWERELELDLTEEERTMADKLLKDDGKLDDDWENWE